MNIQRLYPLLVGVLIPSVLISCTTQMRYQDEPAYYSSLNSSSTSVPYLAIALPSGSPRQLALQLALVKHKNQAAEKERWLLLHHIPYQWLFVEWQNEQLHLLAVGPFNVGAQLSSARKKMQLGMSTLDPMPAVATYISEDIKSVIRAVAKRETSMENDSEIQSSIELDFNPSK